MPLIQSAKPKDVSQNISEFHTGKTYAHTKAKFGKKDADRQAIAVALSTARKVKRAAGGQIPWFVRNEARNMMHTGPINSIVPGRTDNHAMHVPSGSYVLPADHVSSLGQGNTAAGMNILGRMFGTGPYGSGMPRLRARGGKTDAEQAGKPTPIYSAGGEFVVPPQAIIAKWGDLKRGHAALDAWVKSNREKHVKTLQKLPGPAKD